jgi:hypothetical protein
MAQLKYHQLKLLGFSLELDLDQNQHYQFVMIDLKTM